MGFVKHAAHVCFEQRGVFLEEAARQRALHNLQRRGGWAHVHTQRGYGAGGRGHRPESGQGFRGRFSGLAGAHRSFSAVEPLSHSLRWRNPSVATGADSVCNLGRYAARFGVRCAVSEHPPAATRAGRPLWRASTRPLGGRGWDTVGGDGGGGGGGRRKCGAGGALEVCGDIDPRATTICPVVATALEARERRHNRHCLGDAVL